MRWLAIKAWFHRLKHGNPRGLMLPLHAGAFWLVRLQQEQGIEVLRCGCGAIAAFGPQMSRRIDGINTLIPNNDAPCPEFEYRAGQRSIPQARLLQ